MVIDGKVLLEGASAFLLYLCVSFCEVNLSSKMLYKKTHTHVWGSEML